MLTGKFRASKSGGRSGVEFKYNKRNQKKHLSG
jgi:hypothetical protein